MHLLKDYYKSEIPIKIRVLVQLAPTQHDPRRRKRHTHRKQCGGSAQHSLDESFEFLGVGALVRLRIVEVVKEGQKLQSNKDKHGAELLQ